jgi:hypothetical protein
MASNAKQISKRDHMHALSGIVGIAYILAYGLAVYDRIAISDWLTNHLPF